MPAERPFLLPDVEITARHLPVGLPDENRARRVASIEGIEQVTYARSWPDIAPLHFWETQVAVLDHVNKFADGCVDFSHRLSGGSPFLLWNKSFRLRRDGRRT